MLNNPATVCQCGWECCTFQQILFLDLRAIDQSHLTDSRVTGQVIESKFNDWVAGKRWAAECERLSFVLILYVAKKRSLIVFVIPL
jgi:hypothetical protein